MNGLGGKCHHVPIVALRKESVDRNASWGRRHTGPQAVALRKESVDRNIGGAQNGC